MKTDNLKTVQRVVPLDSPDIKNHPRNPRRGNIAAIKDSIKANGYYPTIFIQESTGYILKGNHTWKALKELLQAGFTQYREVTINVLDVTDTEALRIVLADNTSSDYGSYNNEEIYNLLTELNQTDEGLTGSLWTTEDYDNLAFALNKHPTITADEIDAPTDEEIQERKESGELAGEVKTMHDVQEDFSVLFPAEAQYDIPILDIDMQVEAVKLPFMIYSMQRTAKALPRGEVATLAFYAEDVTFEKFWKNPNLLLDWKVRQVVEVNFSTDMSYPICYGLWQTYRKRWLAKYWQTKGIRIMVDVCVNPKFREINFLGVPKGWRAYCNRGNNFLDKEHTIKEYTINHAACVEHAGTEDIIYMIYGGGNVIKELCSDRGWMWIPDEKTLMHGKERDSLQALEKAQLEG